MNNARLTRALVKIWMAEHGWRRIYDRPKDGEQVMIAREWIDRKTGWSDQFLTALAFYDAKTDSFACGCNESFHENRPAKSYHWWQPVADPTHAPIFHLHVGNMVKRFVADQVNHAD